MCGELKVGTLQEKQLSLATEPLAVWPLALFHSGVTFLGENQMWLCKDTQVALRRGPHGGKVRSLAHSHMGVPS